MARPRRSPGAPQTRDRILEAARIEFAANGVAAPLDAIAARCGIRRPSLLHHFPSKPDLIAAVTDDVLRKARERLLLVIGSGTGDYRETMRDIVRVLRELEAEEQGIGAVLTQIMLAEAEEGPVRERLGEFIDIITTTAKMAGADRHRPEGELRAAIAHLVMGELTRLALGEHADRLWGEADGVDPLFRGYFLEPD